MKKNILFLFVATLMLAMYSCSSDDDKNDNDNAQNIVGKWEFVKRYVEIEATPEEFKEYVENHYYEGEQDYLIIYFEFRNDNTGTLTIDYRYSEHPTEIDQFTYITKGNKLIVTYLSENSDRTVIYEAFTSSNSLTIKLEETGIELERTKNYYENNPTYAGGKITKVMEVEEYKRVK